MEKLSVFNKVLVKKHIHWHHCDIWKKTWVWEIVFRRLSSAEVVICVATEFCANLYDFFNWVGVGFIDPQVALVQWPIEFSFLAIAQHLLYQMWQEYQFCLVTWMKPLSSNFCEQLMSKMFVSSDHYSFWQRPNNQTRKGDCSLTFRVFAFLSSC